MVKVTSPGTPAELIDGSETTLHKHGGGNSPDTQWFGSQQPAYTNGDTSYLVPVWKDTTGIITHAVLLSVLTNNTVAVTELRLTGANWVHDGTLARDASVTLNFTAADQLHIHAFAVDSPGASDERILFITGNNDAGTDTFEVDSIDLSGGESLTATAVIIAGSNQPTDTNAMGTVSAALSVLRVGTIFGGTGHRADVTGDEDGFTFTYDDAKVTSIDNSLNVGGSNLPSFSMYLIGTQLLLKAEDPGASNTVGMILWELTAAFVLTDEFHDVMVGPGVTNQSADLFPSGLVPIAGSFALSTQMMILNSDGQPRHFAVAFDLDGLVANT